MARAPAFPRVRRRTGAPVPTDAPVRPLRPESRPPVRVPTERGTMIRAIIFDLDNTLTDFMKMKGAAIEAGLDGMADAGLTVSREVLREHIWRVYDEHGIEYQQVFDVALERAAGAVDPRAWAAGIVAYRRARES